MRRRIFRRFSTNYGGVVCLGSAAPVGAVTKGANALGACDITIEGIRTLCCTELRGIDSDTSSVLSLATTTSRALNRPADAARLVPAIVAVAAGGDKAARCFLEFFAVTIENPNTRGVLPRLPAFLRLVRPQGSQ